MSGETKVGVILSGCGVFDGSEIHESSAICVALTRHGVTPVFYAPDKPHYHEVNHLTGESGDSDRNVLIESGRISRGKVCPIQDLKADSDISGVVFPGGFGAAKNLSTFGVSSEPDVDPEVVRVLKEFHQAKKPIAMCCIAPIVAALALAKQEGVAIKITLGSKGSGWPYCGAIEKAVEFGAQVEELGVEEVCVDEDNKIVTTPAFMFDGKFFEIFDGIQKMIAEFMPLL